MKTKIYILAAALIAMGPFAEAQTTGNPINVTCNDMMQKGDSLYIDAVITISGDAVHARKSLTLTPVLEAPDYRAALPSVLVNGKNRQKIYQREIALGNLQEAPHFAVVKAYEAPQHVIAYKKTIRWETWMKNARFLLAEDLCGCGKEEPVDPLLIADKIRMYPTVRYEVQPVLTYITPVAETEKHRAEVGTAYLDFQVGKSQILPDFRNNATELSKIDNTINAVTHDKNITPKGIVLKGYASPEGSYANNQRLAENRVKALRDYIRTKHDFNMNFFVLESVPEDWTGFKERVQKDTEVPSRDQVLAIIDGDDTPDRKEARLKQLGGGAPYRYVLKDIFPSLRRSEYRIDYTVRFFTVEEGREVIKTHPQQLSLSEMFAVANSYEIGSDEYNEVFEIAVRMYRDDPVANLNAANIALAKRDLAVAGKYLAKAGNTPEAIHARGVLQLLEGNLDAAEPLLKQAEAAGVNGAGKNLEQLAKKRDDNALFDSFDIKGE